MHASYGSSGLRLVVLVALGLVALVALGLVTLVVLGLVALVASCAALSTMFLGGKVVNNLSPVRFAGHQLPLQLLDIVNQKLPDTTRQMCLVFLLFP